LSRWVSHELERRRARAALERQNDRLDQFASILAHDLRNPLNVAQGHLDLARENGTNSLDDVEEALGRMEALIDDVLALARSGQSSLDLETVDLAGVATTAWEVVETEAGSVSVEVERAVRADPGGLKQLFENLFRNAVEHGSPTPSSSTHEDAVGRKASDEPSVADAPEDAVEHGRSGVRVTVGSCDGGFFVADDGPGIPPDERESAFDFGHTSAEGNTGFGLAIVSEIAEGHGWTVDVTESASSGARFEFTNVAFVDE